MTDQTMATTRTQRQSTQPTATAPASIAPIRLPEGTLLHDLRGVKIVWQRELIRFFQDRSRIISSLLQPMTP